MTERVLIANCDLFVSSADLSGIQNYDIKLYLYAAHLMTQIIRFNEGKSVEKKPDNLSF